MSEAAAAAVVESAPTTPAFDASDQHTWSPEQREDWNKTGNIPTPKKQESAPAEKKEEKPPAESASAKESTPVTEPEEKPQEYKARTEKRFTEVLEKVKRLEAELAEAKKPRDLAAPPPAPKAKTAKELAEEYFRANPDKSYEDYLEHRASQIADEKVAADRKQREQEASQRELNSKLEDLVKRYPESKDVVVKAGIEIFDNKKIPNAVKALIDESPVYTDLLYVIGGDATAFADFVKLAESKPAEAIRKIVLMEKGIQDEQAKPADGKPRDESGKFTKTETPEEPKPRAPKPPVEVGGRGAAPQDALKAAAEANDFRSFEAEENRRRFASK